jgi:glutamyl-tRNA(Gln) amidotransferase subunit D
MLIPNVVLRQRMNMSVELSGYKGEALEILRKANLQIGDRIRVTRKGEVLDGILMPRYELADERHIVIKLRNGYNIGIRIHPKIKVEKAGTGVKPSFTPPPQLGEKRELPKVAIVITGGTIASRVDYRTGAVRPALSSDDLFTVVPELAEIANIRTEILFSLLSENVYAPHWSKLAKAAAQHIAAGVDGVVVCHGTDTMAYTSAALSFALQGLPVPVVLVGSQRSSDRPSSDATMNLIDAVRAAACVPIAEVMVGMHETVSDTATVLHRGTKVRKLHTSRRDAFSSVNASPLARVETGEIFILLDDYKKRDPHRKLVLKPDFDEKAALIKFHPCLNPKVIEWYANEGCKGIILEGTGLGHVSKYCFSAIQRAIDGGMFVGMCSQCVHGRVNMRVYDTGRDLLRLGVTPLEDMLPETAFVKLSWILAQTEDLDDVKKIMLTNIADEVTPRSLY